MAICAASASCDGNQTDLPPVQASSARFRYHAADRTEVPSDILERLERHRTDVNAFLGLVDDEPVDYYFFSDPARVSCPLESTDCSNGRSVFSTDPFMEHELLHAYLAGTGTPPQPIIEGMAEVLGCIRGGGSPTVERDWKRAVEEFPTGDWSIYHSSQRLMKHLLSGMGARRTIRYYREAVFTTDAALFALQFERWWGIPFEQVWSAAIGPEPTSESLPICPCQADPISPATGAQLLPHVNASDYRPLDPGCRTFVLDFAMTGGVFLQDCERRTPLVRLLGPAARGRSLIVIRTLDTPHFLSFLSTGTESFVSSDGVALESSCSAASSIALDAGSLGIAGPRNGGDRWYLRLQTSRPLTVTRRDSNASGLRVCQDCTLTACQDLSSTTDTASVSDGAILELTPSASGAIGALDAADVSFI